MRELLSSSSVMAKAAASPVARRLAKNISSMHTAFSQPFLASIPTI
jgi:hypothetical protein